MSYYSDSCIKRMVGDIHNGINCLLDLVGYCESVVDGYNEFKKINNVSNEDVSHLKNQYEEIRKSAFLLYQSVVEEAQEYFEDKNLIVDASHNPNGIKALKENLDYFFPSQKRRFVFGCLKPTKQDTRPISPCTTEPYFLSPTKGCFLEANCTLI